MASASLLAVFFLCIGWLWARFIRGERLAGALLTAWFGASLASLVVLSAGAYAYSERYVAAAPALSATEVATTSTVSVATSLSVTCSVSLPLRKLVADAVQARIRRGRY